MSSPRVFTRAVLTASILAVTMAAAGAQPPLLTPLPAPAAVNPAQVELGRHLFFEPRLSGDGGRSCASCHIPSQGFADGEPLSRGYNGTEYFRNAPGLLSVRLKPRLMWDGRGANLVGVVREMVLSAQFMNGNADIIVERIRQIPHLFMLWRRAFGESGAQRGEQVFQAIAEYLKTLDFGPGPVDSALRGEASLPPLADEGMRLFKGKAGCIACHYGPLLSDGRPHRLGVSDHADLAREPLRAVSLLSHYAEHGLANPMVERGDIGVYAINKNAGDRGSFITPGLRGLSHTAPYMHNGRYASLEDVVAFHDRGGGPGSELHPLRLTARERQALVAFLQALSPPLQDVAEPPTHEYLPVDRVRR
jgi:cytochrome c peroxidase